MLAFDPDTFLRTLHEAGVGIAAPQYLVEAEAPSSAQDVAKCTEFVSKHRAGLHPVLEYCMALAGGKQATTHFTPVGAAELASNPDTLHKPDLNPLTKPSELASPFSCFMPQGIDS